MKRLQENYELEMLNVYLNDVEISSSARSR